MSNSSPVPNPTNIQTDTIFEDARNWFNNMDINSRNQMIVTMYKLCLTTRDASHEKLSQTINSQWNEKFVKQNEQVKKVLMENEVLTKNQDMSVNVLINKLKDVEHNLSNSLQGLSSKITPSMNGKLGEDHIDQILSGIPNASFTNNTQNRGGGDFLLKIENYQIMIESKNWTNSSIKGNPKEIENFKKAAVEAKEEIDIDFAIMALHRVTDLKGKFMEMEMEYTKKGILILIYVTNLFNHPDRILYAIDAGIFLLKQQSRGNVNKEKFIFQVNSFLKGIDSMEESIKEREKTVRDMTSLIRKDSDHITTMKLMLDNMLNNTEQVSIKDRIITFYMELSTSGKKITKAMLEGKCTENKIPARWIRSLGGIKAIKEAANRKIKGIGDYADSDANLGLDPSSKDNDNESDSESEDEDDEE